MRNLLSKHKQENVHWRRKRHERGGWFGELSLIAAFCAVNGVKDLTTDLLYKAEQSKIGQLFPFSSVHITILTQCLENECKEQCTITNGEVQSHEKNLINKEWHGPVKYKWILANCWGNLNEFWQVKPAMA